MTGETTRPVCVYAMNGLKRNSTKMMVVMCIGLALALYGLYVQARSQNNPHYMPTVAVATNWFYHHVGQHIIHPSSLINGCASQHKFKPSVRQMFMYRLVHPITRYSGLLNGLINLVQILVLKICCKSFAGTNAIIALSGLGLAISMTCMIGAFATCKLMCISCLGIHHIVIIYLAMRRRKILKTILCPSTGQNEQASCTFGAAPGTGGSGACQPSGAGAQQHGAASGAQQAAGQHAAAARHTSSCVTRRANGAPDTTHDQSRRRSNRL